MFSKNRKTSFYILAAFFCLFVFFLYGPMFAIITLSFQGPNGGLTFPMNGFSTHWFSKLFQEQRVGDFQGSFSRSLTLAVIVMVATVVISLSAGMAFRKKFKFSNSLFYLTISRYTTPRFIY